MEYLVNKFKLKHMTEERKLKVGDVVQVKNDENLPKEFIGCLGYVMNVDTQTSIWVRFYQPKTK